MTDVAKTITIRGNPVGVDKLMEQCRALGLQVEVAEQKVVGLAGGLGRLERSLDPVARATQTFERAQSLLQRGLDTGRISAERYNQLLDISRQRMVASTAAANASATAIHSQAAAARTASTALNTMNGNVGNLAAQFQDIGVTAAMGMNPLMIALQQGTQISAVLGPMGARGAVTALGAAFASIISPVSLATIAIIGLGTYGAQALYDLVSGGEDANMTMEKQREIIASAAQGWGDLVPALRQYVDELARLKSEGELVAATEQRTNDIYASSRAKLGDIAVGVAEVTLLMIDMGATSTDIAVVRSALADLETKIQDGTATADEMQGSISALASALTGSGVSAAQDMAAQLQSLSALFLGAAESAKKLQIESALALNAKNQAPLGTLSPLRSGGGQFLNPQQALEFDAANTQSQFQIAAARAANSNRRGGGGASRASGISDIDRERAAIKELIDQMEHERDLIGMSALERDKANALRRAGKNATDAERAAIASLVEETHRAREAEKALAEQKKALGEAQEYGLNLANDALTAIIVNGEKAEDVFKKLAVQIAFAVAEAALLNSGPLAGLFGGGGGGLLDFFIPEFGFAKGGAFSGGNVTAFARGGTFSNSIVDQPTLFPFAKGTGLMGEAGPEAIMPLKRGADGSLGVRMFQPQMPQAANTNISIGGATIIVNGNADKDTLAEIKKEIMRSEQRMQASILPTVKDAQRRRVF